MVREGGWGRRHGVVKRRRHGVVREDHTTQPTEVFTPTSVRGEGMKGYTPYGRKAPLNSLVCAPRTLHFNVNFWETQLHLGQHVHGRSIN